MEAPRQIQTDPAGLGFSKCGFCDNYLARGKFDIYEKGDQFYRACPECSDSEKTLGFKKVR